MTMVLSPSGFVAQLARIAAVMPMAEHEAIEAGCIIVETEAKRVIGTYDYGWPQLDPATIARKKNGNTPLLETGDMRASIEHSVEPGVGWIGSNSMIAVYQELGTRSIPARSFLGGAAIHKEREVYEVIGRYMMAALISPHQNGGFHGWTGSGTNIELIGPPTP